MTISMTPLFISEASFLYWHARNSGVTIFLKLNRGTAKARMYVTQDFGRRGESTARWFFSQIPRNRRDLNG
jgi:hypothetical protein